MSVQTDQTKLTIGQFVEQFRGESVSLGPKLSYLCVSVTLSEEETKEYLEEPLQAMPPAVKELLPKMFVLLVPYIERVNGKPKGSQDYVSLVKPPETRWLESTTAQIKDESVLVFGVSDQEMADYHYFFYRAVAELVVDKLPPSAGAQYSSMLREELSGHVHGEVDEASWALKQALLRRQTNIRRETKPFQAYSRQSMIDTMTLYMHGICCDIDVDTGPRQLPSRFLRKRLQLLHTLCPPPSGYALFPEELKK